jgi:hypothetical protein
MIKGEIQRIGFNVERFSSFLQIGEAKVYCSVVDSCRVHLSIVKVMLHCPTTLTSDLVVADAKRREAAM